ncbi:MAG: hypothetical protein H7326_08235 [Bdellovibrionaceae bacterium]|nr:hypothetical protein [Pseudobdellovibrionaceae bacterium]
MGNVGKVPATFHWVVDLTPPEANFIDITPSEEFSTSTEKSLTFSATESSTFECSLNGASFASCVSPVRMQSLGESNYVFVIRAINAAGNVSLPVTYSWSVDLTKPTLSLGIVLPSLGMTNANDISVEFAVRKIERQRRTSLAEPFRERFCGQPRRN